LQDWQQQQTLVQSPAPMTASSSKTARLVQRPGLGSLAAQQQALHSLQETACLLLLQGIQAACLEAVQRQLLQAHPVCCSQALQDVQDWLLQGQRHSAPHSGLAQRQAAAQAWGWVVQQQLPGRLAAAAAGQDPAMICRHCWQQVLQHPSR
jgi:hypothetical protein